MVKRNLFIVLASSMFIIASSGCSTTNNDSRKLETGTNQKFSGDILGRYELVAVNGVAIPGTVLHDGADIIVYSGVFEIRADGTCSSKTVFSPPSGAKITREVIATYSRSGLKLIMQWEGAGMTTGTIDANTFAMDNHGMLFNYKKRATP